MCQKINAAIAAQFVARAEARGLKGKARDNAALEFALGGVSALRAAGLEAEAGHLEVVTVMLVSVRGYRGLAELAG